MINEKTFRVIQQVWLRFEDVTNYKKYKLTRANFIRNAISLAAKRRIDCKELLTISTKELVTEVKRIHNLKEKEI